MTGRAPDVACIRAYMYTVRRLHATKKLLPDKSTADIDIDVDMGDAFQRAPNEVSVSMNFSGFAKTRVASFSLGVATRR